MHKFNVRPYPRKNEALLGYLLTLADRNGLTGIRDLLDTFNMHTLSLKKLDQMCQRELNQIVPKLSQFLNRDPASCLSPFIYTGSPTWIYQESRAIRNVRMQHPRICPCCLNEEAMIDWRWGLCITSTCPKHHHELIDYCPNCKEMLDWKSSLYTGCHKCNFKWSEYTQITTYLMTKMELTIWEKSIDESKVLSELIATICTVIVVLARPYDSMYSVIESMPHVTDHSELVRNVYMLLEDTNLQHSFVQQCKQHRSILSSLGPQAIFFPALQIEQKTRQALPQKTSLNMVEGTADDFKNYDVPIKKARLHITNNSNTESLCFHVTSHELVTFMGISQQNISLLVQRGVLTPINEAKELKNQLFDLRKIAELRLSQTTNSPQKEITVNAKQKFIEGYFFQYGELLADILTKRIDGNLDHSALFEQVTITAQDFKNWRIENLRKKTATDLPYYKVRPILTKKQFGKLALPLHEHHGKLFITGAYIFDLLSTKI